MYTLVSIADLPDSGLFQPLGAVLFNEDSYVETVKLIELTGVPYTDYTPGERWAFDWKSGEAELIPPAPQEFAELVAVEYQRYSEFWNEVYLPFSEIGYKVLHHPTVLSPDNKTNCNLLVRTVCRRNLLSPALSGLQRMGIRQSGYP